MEQTGKARSVGTEACLPVTAVAEANLPLMSLGGVLNPGVSVQKENVKTVQRMFRSEGERVYTVQYCKVNFKWYSSKKIETRALGPTKWKIHWGVRSVEELDEDDVVEAVLEEEFNDD